MIITTLENFFYIFSIFVPPCERVKHRAKYNLLLRMFLSLGGEIKWLKLSYLFKKCVYLFLFFKAKIQNAVTGRNQIGSFGTSSSSDFYGSSFYLCSLFQRVTRPSVCSSFKLASLWWPLEHLKIPMPFHESLVKETEDLLSRIFMVN